MIAWSDSTFVEDVLAHGVDDWVDDGLVYDVAMRSGVKDRRVLRSLCFGLLAEVLISELMVAGRVTRDGFVPWRIPPEAALDRIVRSWQAWGLEPPTPGAVCWLANTAKGDEIGVAVLGRERE